MPEKPKYGERGKDSTLSPENLKIAITILQKHFPQAGPFSFVGRGQVGSVFLSESTGKAYKVIFKPKFADSTSWYPKPLDSFRKESFEREVRNQSLLGELPARFFSVQNDDSCAVIEMEFIDFKPGELQVADEGFRRAEVERIENLLRQLRLWPPSTAEFVLDESGKVRIIDSGELVNWDEVNSDVVERVHEALEYHFGLSLITKGIYTL